MMTKNNDWFSTWFDSHFYHILYKNRDYKEAEFFITNLISHLKIQDTDKVLDLACGKGRHSIYLNKQGLEVIGVDLSPESIAYANKYSNERLHFYEHDMREVLDQGNFDFVLNLFTSFGYFEDDNENQKTIDAVNAILKPNGVFVLDFMNSHKVIQNLVKEEQKTIDNVTFNLKRSVQNGFIVKDIAFTNEEKEYHFQERVKGISEENFQKYFQKAGLTIKSVFGNYGLSPFNKETSDRLIFILEKK